ncbi:MAG: hypothetical protein ABIA21_03540 [Candidatus Aenigmatarchaeota archaeon]
MDLKKLGTTLISDLTRTTYFFPAVIDACDTLGREDKLLPYEEKALLIYNTIRSCLRGN